GLVPELDDETVFLLLRLRPRVPPCRHRTVHAGRDTQDPAGDSVAVLNGCLQHVVERVFDLLYVLLGGDMHEVLRLPHCDCSAEVSREGVDTPVARIGSDGPHVWSRRGGKLSDHRFEIVAGSAEASPAEY